MNEPPAQAQWRPTGLQVALSMASLAVAALLLAVFFPKVTGAAWSESWAALAGLGFGHVVGLTAIWLIGLGIYTWVYTASLPGLRHGQALALNLTGSLVSNVLPFGGAAGVANTYALTFSWGFGGVATSLMVLVSGLANLLVRLLLPIVGLLALWFSGFPLSEVGGKIAFATLGILTVASVALILVLTSARVAGFVGAGADRLLTGLVRLLKRDRPVRSLRSDMLTLQSRATVILARKWHLIAFGMIGYYASETILFGWALHVLGSSVTWAQVIAAFALSRVLTSVVVTPSGVGISEAGTAAALIMFGVDAPVAAAGVVVLGFYTYLIEIPAGIGGWGLVAAARRRWRRPRGSVTG